MAQMTVPVLSDVLAQPGVPVKDPLDIEMLVIWSTVPAGSIGALKAPLLPGAGEFGACHDTPPKRGGFPFGLVSSSRHSTCAVPLLEFEQLTPAITFRCSVSCANVLGARTACNKAKATANNSTCPFLKEI